jgi:hypothetical protein
VGRLLPAVFLVIVVASLGPQLKAAGTTGVPMPWKLALGLPLLHRALPGRFIMYAVLVLAIAVAVWVSLGGRFAWARWLVAAFGALLLFPNLGPAHLGRATPPPFFADGLYRRAVSPGDLVVSSGIPIGRSMLFQAESDMYFRLPSGYFGSSPPGVAQRRIARALCSGRPPLFAPRQVHAFLERNRVGAILVVADRASRRARWRRFLHFLHVSPTRVGGVDVYRLGSRDRVP